MPPPPGWLISFYPWCHVKVWLSTRGNGEAGEGEQLVRAVEMRETAGWPCLHGSSGSKPPYNANTTQYFLSCFCGHTYFMSFYINILFSFAADGRTTVTWGLRPDHLSPRGPVPSPLPSPPPGRGSSDYLFLCWTCLVVSSSSSMSKWHPPSLFQPRGQCCPRRTC